MKILFAIIAVVILISSQFPALAFDTPKPQTSSTIVPEAEPSDSVEDQNTPNVETSDEPYVEPSYTPYVEPSRSPRRKKNPSGYFTGFGSTLTGGVRFTDDYKFVSMDLPLWQVQIPFIQDLSEYLQATGALEMIWGTTQFYCDPTLSLGLQYYPFGEGEILNIHAACSAGSFFLNNFTAMASIGMNIDIPIDRYFNITLGADYFYRNSSKLFAYMSGDQWYMSGFGLGLQAGVRMVIP